MFKNTYRIKFNIEHVDAVGAILETLGILPKLHAIEGYLVEQYVVWEFKVREKDVDTLKAKLYKYGMTVA